LVCRFLVVSFCLWYQGDSSFIEWIKYCSLLLFLRIFLKPCSHEFLWEKVLINSDSLYLLQVCLDFLFILDFVLIGCGFLGIFPFKLNYLIYCNITITIFLSTRLIRCYLFVILWLGSSFLFSLFLESFFSSSV
jgi:hypothetical protein